MLSAIDNLREIARRCLTGEDLDADQARWLGDSLRRFLDHRCSSVDDALGLRFAHGGIPWWREEALRARDAALRELADRLYPDLSLSARSRGIHTLAVRYAASAWRIDREHDTMPSCYRGKPHEYLWWAFASGAAMPISERQLRNVLRR